MGDTMEDELNYLRSEIAKIRMEKEKANGITPGKTILPTNLRKFGCKREANNKSKYLKDIERKNSACVAKTKKLGRITSTKNNKDNIDINKRKIKTETPFCYITHEHTISGILELFESDKESILMYHLAMLESKNS